MQRRTVRISCLIVLIMALVCAGSADAARNPDIVSYDAKLLQDAVSVSIAWQSEYPVVRAVVSAGDERKEVELDPYDDNVKDASGYHGEASIVIEVDLRQFDDEQINYVMQLVDDVGKRSRRVSGSLTKAAAGMTADQGTETDGDITPSTGGGQPGMIDKVIKVMERHDTPPVVSDIRVTVTGDKTVTVSGSAMDDKGLTEVRIQIIDGSGGVAGEKVFSDLGRTWQGTTGSFRLAPGGYAVVAQAIDTAGNRSPEIRKKFTTKPGTMPDRTPPVTKAVPAGTTFVNQGRVTFLCQDNAGGSGCRATYYTTDGTVPTITSPRYTGPFTVSTTRAVQFFSVDKAGNREAVKRERYTITPLPPPPKPPVVIPGATCRIKITDAIHGHHGPRGVFFQETVTLMVPEGYARIVVAADAEGMKPWGADDWATVTVTSPTGAVQRATLGKNDAMGKPVGEQYVLSNVMKLQPGLNTVRVELWNEFAPPGSNQSSSAMWLVVQCPAGQSCRDGRCVPAVQPPPLPPKDIIPPVTQAAPAGGTYAQAQQVTLTCSDAGGSGCRATHYTIDGTVPTLQSPLYSGPFTLSETATVRFFSVDTAGNRGQIQAVSYTIKVPEQEKPPVTEIASFEATPAGGGTTTLTGDEDTEGIGVTVPPGALGRKTTIEIGRFNTPEKVGKRECFVENSRGMPGLAEYINRLNERSETTYYDPLRTFLAWMNGDTKSSDLQLSLEPGGTQFNTPVTVEIPRSLIDLPGTVSPGDVTALISSAGEGKEEEWDVVTAARLTDRTLTLSVDHFSKLRVLWNIYLSPGRAVWWLTSDLPVVRDYGHDFAQAIVCSDTEPRLDPDRLPSNIDLLMYLANPVHPDQSWYWQARGVPDDEQGFRKRLKELGLRNGGEEELSDWLRKQKPSSVSAQDLYKRAYRMARGDIYQTFLLCHNTLRGHRYGKGWGNRNDANLQKSLKPLVGIGDATGQRYHLFGMALYGFMSRHASDLRAPPTLEIRKQFDEAFQRDLTVFIEEGVVSGDLTTEPEEAAVDRQGYNIGRDFYNHVRNRTKARMKAEGFFRLQSKCPLEIEQATVAPDPASVGQQIIFEAHTSRPADRVVLETNKAGVVDTVRMVRGKDGTYWKYIRPEETKPGKILYKMTAFGSDGAESKPETGSIAVKTVPCGATMKILRDRHRFPHKIVLRPRDTKATVWVKHETEFKNPQCATKRSTRRWWATMDGTEREIKNPPWSTDGLWFSGFPAGRHSITGQVCVGEDCGEKTTADFEVIPRTYWAMEKVTYGEPKWKSSFSIQKVAAGEEPDTYVTASYILIGYGPGTKEEVEAFIEEKPKHRRSQWNLNAWANYKGKDGAFSGFTETDHDHITGLSGKNIQALHKKQSPGNYIRW